MPGIVDRFVLAELPNMLRWPATLDRVALVAAGDRRLHLSKRKRMFVGKLH